MAKEALLAQQFGKIEKDPSGGFLFSDYLYELYRLTPASIFLISLDAGSEKTLCLMGMAGDPEVIFNYLGALGRSRILKNVRLDYMEKGNKNSGTKEIKFKIIFSGENSDHRH